MTTTRGRRYARSLALYAQASALMPGGSQTTSKRPAQFAFGHYPIYASHGRGGHVWDIDGHEYIDFVMALGPVTSPLFVLANQLYPGRVLGQSNDDPADPDRSWGTIVLDASERPAP